MKEYTYYWRSNDWHELQGGKIRHVAGKGLRRKGLEIGDRIYVVTNLDGEMYLGGSLDVAQVVDRTEARRLLGRDVGVAGDYAIAATAQDFHADLRVPLRVTRALRFRPENKSLLLKGERLDQLTLRGLRELTPDSAALLDDLLGVRAGDGGRDYTPPAERLDDIAAVEIERRADIGPVEKRALIDARRGHGVYRRNLEKIEIACRITGLLDRRHLRASHIKPWRDSTDEEKLDGFNGLLLSPHFDHLFDLGYLSFDDDGTLKVSRYLNPAVLRAWYLDRARRVGPFRPEQRRYLEYHRANVFESHGGGRRRVEVVPAWKEGEEL